MKGKTIRHEYHSEVISKVEADHIKAKTSYIRGAIVREWIALILGGAIILLGLVLYILDQKNVYHIALMSTGVFILAGMKPKIAEILNQAK